MILEAASPPPQRRQLGVDPGKNSTLGHQELYGLASLAICLALTGTPWPEARTRGSPERPAVCAVGHGV